MTLNCFCTFIKTFVAELAWLEVIEEVPGFVVVPGFVEVTVFVVVTGFVEVTGFVDGLVDGTREKDTEKKYLFFFVIKFEIF